MSSFDRVPDRTILAKVNQRLSRTGMGATSNVSVTVHNGDVTLTGSLQYEHQRRNILRAAEGVAGVRRVIDHLQIASKPRHY